MPPADREAQARQALACWVTCAGWLPGEHLRRVCTRNRTVYGCRPAYGRARWPSKLRRLGLLPQVAGAGRVDSDARGVSRGHVDGPQIPALRRGRLGPDELVEDRRVILGQLLGVE